jgi:hypothetical protein
MIYWQKYIHIFALLAAPRSSPSPINPHLSSSKDMFARIDASGNALTRRGELLTHDSVQCAGQT